MVLDKETIAELHKKYKRNLNQLRLDIQQLTKIKRPNSFEKKELETLLAYRMQFTPYGGLAYNSQTYLDMLQQLLKEREKYNR